MQNTLTNGIWPTMMTPMREDAAIDFDATGRLLEWYRAQGAHGIFALCYSSEIRSMSFKERLTLMRYLADHLPKSMQMTVSGHVADNVEEQIDEFGALLDAGAPRLVMIANRLAAPDDDDETLIRNAERILNALPDAEFGLYECPFPYKRYLSPQTLGRLAGTNRFTFMKDTCCDSEVLRLKAQAVKGTALKIFNANAATLWQSWKDGCAGFSGIMCNFHTDLYVRLWEAFQQNDEALGLPLQDALGVFSSFERMNYPVCAKLYQREALGMTGVSRLKSLSDMRPSYYVELAELHRCEDRLRERIRAYDAEKQKGN